VMDIASGARRQKRGMISFFFFVLIVGILFVLSDVVWDILLPLAEDDTPPPLSVVVTI